MSGRSAVVVAHPDDEILWLSSAMASAAHIVLCYGAPFGKPAKAAARRRAVANLRLATLVDLAIPESGTRLLVDWRHPLMTPTGIGIADPDAQLRYDDNFNTLLAQLRPVLAGCADVYTHNPWGEYGHPEHVQVHRAVTALQAELGYTVWFSNYAGPLTLTLARQLGAGACWAEKRVVRPNKAIARRLQWVYLCHRAWTWALLHRWPAEETMYAQPPGPDRAGWCSLAGETLLDVAGLRWWPPGRDPMRRPAF
jgi:LmbE family N-acetylglucosaminyl deacetylase